MERKQTYVGGGGHQEKHLNRNTFTDLSYCVRDSFEKMWQRNSNCMSRKINLSRGRCCFSTDLIKRRFLLKQVLQKNKFFCKTLPLSSLSNRAGFNSKSKEYEKMPDSSEKMWQRNSNYMSRNQPVKGTMLSSNSSY